MVTEKLETLESLLGQYRRVVVAFSGGVDSTFLLWAALDTLGAENVLAVTATAAIFSRRSQATAARVAGELGATHRFIPGGQLDDEQFVQNPPNRCYFCKLGIMTKLLSLARAEGYDQVIEGSNLDDEGQYRPGRQAVQESGVASPLAQANMTKDEIRTLSRQVGLPTWDWPAQTCLATRFPHDQRITEGALAQVEAAEDALAALGFRELRVRHHGDLARIEVAADQIARLVDPELRARVTGQLKGVGYRYVALDLDGYRWGSLEQQTR